MAEVKMLWKTDRFRAVGNDIAGLFLVGGTQL